MKNHTVYNCNMYITIYKSVLYNKKIILLVVILVSSTLTNSLNYITRIKFNNVN